MVADAALMGSVMDRAEARLVEPAVASEPPVVKHHDHIAVDCHWNRLLDDQDAIEAALELLR